MCSLTLLMTLLPQAVKADEPLAGPRLLLRQINITGDESVVLQNYGDAAILHLNEYWLGYTSSESAPNVIPSQQLPDVTLQPGQAFVLNNGSAEVCGAVGVSKLGFSLANTAGTLALKQLVVDTETTSTFQTVQYVTWGKKTPSSTMYANMNDETAVNNYLTAQGVTSSPSWYFSPATNDLTAAWQSGYQQDCVFTPVVSKTEAAAPQAIEWQQEDDDIPFTVVAPQTFALGSSGPYLPAADVGLRALQVSEILPNPASPQTDAQDEFIELYNPNAAAFDLTGFILQIGSTTSAMTHTYSFPDGTLVAAKGFMVFKSADTHLSLSNSGGQVWLLDPFGTVVANSDAYDTAKDGLAWVHAAGKWQWTALPTPGAANKVSAVASSSSKAATVKGQNVTAVKGASTSKSPVGTTASGGSNAAAATSVHPFTLVAVVLAALLYGAYEYRSDVANYLYQLRGNRAAGRKPRP